jgi:hypothetical protein
MKTDAWQIYQRELKRVEQFHRWVSVQILMKGTEVEKYMAALLTTGLALRFDGIEPFGPDEVPTAYRPEGQGIAGTAHRVLVEGKYLIPFYGDVPSRDIFHGRRTSLADSRNGAKVFVYHLGPTHLIQAWLLNRGYKTPRCPEPQGALL